jgi:hypothetical protein
MIRRIFCFAVFWFFWWVNPIPAQFHGGPSSFPVVASLISDSPPILTGIVLSVAFLAVMEHVSLLALTPFAFISARCNYQAFLPIILAGAYLLWLRDRHVWAGIVLGLGCVVRAEVLAFIGAIALASVMWKEYRRMSLVAVSVALILTAFVTLETGSASATNSGSVAYISLGQSPLNPWGIAYKDESAYKVTDDPVSREGNRALWQAWADSIKAHPFAGVVKLATGPERQLLSGLMVTVDGPRWLRFILNLASSAIYWLLIVAVGFLFYADRGAVSAFPFIVLVTQCAVSSVFFADARFNVAPFLLLLIAWGDR